MSDLRFEIQTARFRDDAPEWTRLVEGLLAQDMPEGMKAALSGATKATPGSDIKQEAVRLIVEHLPAYAESDVAAAVQAAIQAAVASKPQTELRHQATNFILDQAEALSKIDFKLAVTSADFAFKWAVYDSSLANEAKEVRDRIIASEKDIQAGFTTDKEE